MFIFLSSIYDEKFKTYRRTDSPGSEFDCKKSVSDYGVFWPNREELEDGAIEEIVDETKIYNFAA